MDTHPRRPPVRRVPARHAHTCHAPSSSAACASRHPLEQTPGILLRPLPHGFSPSGWNGELFSWPRLRRSWQTRHRPPLRHTGLTAQPWSLCGQRLRRQRLRRSAPPARLCPARFLGSSAECAFPSPPFRFCSLFSGNAHSALRSHQDRLILVDESVTDQRQNLRSSSFSINSNKLQETQFQNSAEILFRLQTLCQFSNLLHSNRASG